MNKMKSTVIVATMLVMISMLMVGCGKKTVDSNNNSEMSTDQNFQEDENFIDKTSEDDSGKNVADDNQNAATNKVETHEGKVPADLDKETIDSIDVWDDEPSDNQDTEDKPENPVTEKDEDSSNELPEVILPMDIWED